MEPAYDGDNSGRNESRGGEGQQQVEEGETGQAETGVALEGELQYSVGEERHHGVAERGHTRDDTEVLHGLVFAEVEWK